MYLSDKKNRLHIEWLMLSIRYMSSFIYPARWSDNHLHLSWADSTHSLHNMHIIITGPRRLWDWAHNCDEISLIAHCYFNGSTFQGTIISSYAYRMQDYIQMICKWDKYCIRFLHSWSSWRKRGEVFKKVVANVLSFFLSVSVMCREAVM